MNYFSLFIANDQPWPFPNLGKNYPKSMYYTNFGYLAVTFEPESLESQSKSQETQILA